MSTTKYMDANYGISTEWNTPQRQKRMNYTWINLKAILCEQKEPHRNEDILKDSVYLIYQKMQTNRQ